MFQEEEQQENNSLMWKELSQDSLYISLLEQNREEIFLLLDKMFNEDGSLKNEE